MHFAQVAFQILVENRNKESANVRDKGLTFPMPDALVSEMSSVEELCPQLDAPWAKWVCHSLNGKGKEQQESKYLIVKIFLTSQIHDH